MGNAKSIIKSKRVRDDGSIIELVVWELSSPVPPCAHHFKYRLYYGSQGVCRVRYDNEAGKGDHRHIGEVENVYVFSTLKQLIADFSRDVSQWR